MTKTTPVLVFLVIAFASTVARASEIVKFTLFDGETTDGKLSLPSHSSRIRELVIFVHGTGPATYENRRGSGANAFSYFGYFAEEFNRRGIAFFTYNKRGVTLTDTPPYERIDREKFRKALPSVETRDLATYIKVLRAARRLKHAKIVLLGWSEGTILAAMAAENHRNKISALFLNGYAHDNLAEIIKWQNTGGSSMVNLRKIFDKDKDGVISRSEYESDDKTVAAFRGGPMQNTTFDQLDANKNGSIEQSDFAVLLAAKYKGLTDAIERGDDDWIWNNYFHVTSNWLKEHAALEANKDRMLRLSLPIYIFHGEADANCRVEGVLELRKSFDLARKHNLRENIFPGADHDLNFLEWLTKKEIPAGIKKMFDVASELNK